MKLHYISFLISIGACTGILLPSPVNAQKTPAADPQTLLEKGQEALLAYDFRNAGKYYGEYKTRIAKLKLEPEEDIDKFRKWASNGERQLERVQKIIVIDSVAVPAMDFFKYIRVPASAGFLLPASEIPFKGGRESASMAYSPESGNLMLWAEPDTVGTYRIVESSRLSSGGFTDPVYAPEFLNGGGDVDFPVLSTDGLTLWYCSDGEDSIGGYDIFETVRDSSTGEYMPPSNIGMPFNSPYDDFLLINDEENGVGWWATDRNQLEDMVTLYVYILPEMRENFDGEVSERIDAARIGDYRATWSYDESDEEDADDGNEEDSDGRVKRSGPGEYMALAEIIRGIRPGQRPRKEDFIFPVSGGKYFLNYDELPSESVKALMREYLSAKAAFDRTESDLQLLRREYSKSRDKALGERIKALELQYERQQRDMNTKKSEVYKSL